MRIHSTPLAILAVVFAMISIQSGASLAKNLFPIIGPQGTTALRLLFASIVLCLTFRPWRKKLTRKELMLTSFYGLSLGGMNYLFYLALNRIPLGIAVAFEFTGPLLVAFLSSKKAHDFLWAGVAVIGIILILPLNQFAAPLDPLGVAFALGAGMCWALYIFFGQKTGASVHGGMATTIGMVIATLFFFPLGAWSAGAKLLTMKESEVLLAIGVGIFSSALPYSLEMIALKKLPAQTFSILMSLEPAIAALSGLVFLKEYLSVSQWTAIFLIIMASCGSSMAIKQAEV